jgi:hypothetical protein
MRQAGRKQLPAASGGSSPQTMHPFRATATGAPVSVSPAQQAGRQEAGRLLLPRRAGPSHFPAHAPRKPTVRQKAENVLFQRDSQRHFGVEGRGSAHRYTAGEKGIAADTMGIQGKTQSLWRDLQKNPDATMNKLVTRIQSGKGSAADQAIYDHVRRAGGLKKVLGRTAPPSATPPRPTPPTPATSPEALQYEQAMQQGLL